MQLIWLYHYPGFVLTLDYRGVLLHLSRAIGKLAFLANRVAGLQHICVNGSFEYLWTPKFDLRLDLRC